VVPLLQAEAFEREGHTDRALGRYQAARDRGEGRLEVARRVVQILAEQGRFNEAHVLLGKLPARGHP
jgi:hypothetical protein